MAYVEFHQRKLIRDAVKAALIAADTAAEERVYTTRTFEWRVKDLPAISIYTVTEPVNPASRETSPKTLLRELALAIEFAVVVDDAVDDAIDALCLEIERAMHRDETFGDVCGESTLANTEITFAEDGDQQIGQCRLTYTVRYNTGAPEREDVEADLALGDFVEGGIKTKVAGPAMHDDDDADDEVEPEQ